MQFFLFIEGYVSQFMIKDYSGWFCKNLRWIVEDIYCSAGNLNTKDYLRFFFEDFLQIFVKKMFQRYSADYIQTFTWPNLAAHTTKIWVYITCSLE